MILGILLGAIAGSLFGAWKPEWVRGAVGCARGFVLGRAPARNLKSQSVISNLKPQGATSSVHVGNISAESVQEAPDREHDARSVVAETRETEVGLQPASDQEVRARAPNKTINLARAAMNVAGFLWRWKWAILVVVLVVVIGGALRNPFGWGKSRDELRAELREAEVSKNVLEHERDLSNHATNLAEETLRVEAETREAVKKGQEDIANAVGQDDFDLLYSAYARAYGRVFDNAEREDRSDPSTGRSTPLRRAGADRA